MSTAPKTPGEIFNAAYEPALTAVICPFQARDGTVDPRHVSEFLAHIIAGVADVCIDRERQEAWFEMLIVRARDVLAKTREDH